MKINEIKLKDGNVNCYCVYSVQGTDHNIEVNFSENDLYLAANQRGKESWENEDVVKVVSQIVSMPCSF